MLCRDIINVIENTYPKQAALEWDNVGLLGGRTEKEVEKIYVVFLHLLIFLFSISMSM